ncbi:tetratricopeptide repeat protein [Clostridium neuense]|uniref:Tetratricopeptide repeat protein n=1 Tax=Clostridium neuense TaxID=1728934 RepID=A0ABW8TLU4_9CLOT
MKYIPVKEIIKKLNPDIDCQEYTYNLNTSTTKCNKAIEKYISKIDKKDLESKNINNIKNTLSELIFNEDEASDINTLIYFNIIEETIFIYSFSGFNDSFTYTLKKDNSFSFLRFLLDRFFEDKNCNIDNDFTLSDHLTIKTRKYIKNIFLKTCGKTINNKSGDHTISIFEEINYISTLSYEGADIRAKLAIMNKNLADNFVSYYIKLDRPVSFSEYRKVRKLLQTSDESTYLIGDNEKIYGLGKFNKLDELKLKLENNNTILIVEFTGRFEYKISRAFIADDLINSELVKHVVKESLLLNIKNGKPNLIENKYSESILESILKQAFKDDFKKDSEEKIASLKRIVYYAKNQKHGTTLVITTPELAKSETSKLVNQSIKIENKNLANCDYLENLIYKITNIDGAMYIDTNSNCHAIGVILDGTADERHGDSSRGSRYNSAIKYSLKEGIGNSCVIIVISEDGMIDIVYRGDKYDSIIKQINKLFNKADTLFNDKDYKGAINILNKILKLDASSSKAYLNKGLALSALERKNEAINCYDLAIKFKPDYAKAYYNKGTVLFYLGKKEESIECYNLAIKFKPDYAKAYYNKGNTLSYLGRREEAIKCYDLAIKFKSDYAYAYNNKGTALSDLDKKEEAIRCYNLAIKLKPNYAKAYCNKGNALCDLGKQEEAIKCYNLAIKLKPNYIYAYNNKGIALSTIGNQEEADECFKKAEELEEKLKGNISNEE